MLDWILLICLFFVISIIFKIISQQKCLSEATLKRLMAQRLHPAEKNQIIAHLGIYENAKRN